MEDQKTLIRRLLTQPAQSVDPPQPPSALVSTEESALAQLLSEFDQPDLKFPTTTHTSKDTEPELEPLSEWEICLLFSRQNLLRILRADRWNVVKAKQRLIGTIAWRRETKMNTQDFSSYESLIAKEGPTGKLFVLGFDNFSRPVIHMRPRFQNTTNTLDRLSFSYFGIDRALDLMPDYQDKMTFIIDTGGNAESPSMSMQREFLRILAHHYCERLGKAAMLNVNMVFRFMVKLISPFMDSVTLAKMSLDDETAYNLIPEEQRDAHLKGTSGFEWNSELYWQTLYEECAKRRVQRLERFRHEGGKMGWSEWASTPSESSEPAHADDAVTPNGAEIVESQAVNRQDSRNSTAVGTPNPGKRDNGKVDGGADADATPA